MMYSAAAPSSSRTLPRMGISNHTRLTTVISSTSANPMRANGTVLPRMNSSGLMGVTIICSIVPISFSRTTAMLVSMSVTRSTMMAITPGT